MSVGPPHSPNAIPGHPPGMRAGTRIRRTEAVFRLLCPAATERGYRPSQNRHRGRRWPGLRTADSTNELTIARTIEPRTRLVEPEIRSETSSPSSMRPSAQPVYARPGSGANVRHPGAT
jgi:hypothetical protein